MLIFCCYSDRFTFSYAKDGKLTLTIKNAVPTDAGVYKCAVRGKDMRTVATKARLLVGGELLLSRYVGLETR